MQYNLSLSSKAFSDINNAYLFYEDQQPGLGERFVTSVEQAYSKLAATPRHYSFLNNKKGLRDVRIKDFPFVIIFQIVQDSVLVLRKFNTSRKPLSL
jgi:plasmid stabilization system protein ParE